MLAESRRRHDHPLVLADAFALPFADHSFERILAGHFYGHLDPGQRRRFLEESTRVAPSLVVLDAAIREEVQPEQIQERVLNDGSVYPVFKRYFTGDQLAEELGGADVLFEGRWFVIVEAKA
jgi:demethylmenaquinone methyltransferase/2-methoxy-6-polyprenyl-1,4-benzoquinol methylase